MYVIGLTIYNNVSSIQACITVVDITARLKGLTVSYRIDVVTDSVPDAIRHAGGLMFDRRRAGWQVVVVTDDAVHSRALTILGARIESPGDAESRLSVAERGIRTVVAARSQGRRVGSFSSRATSCCSGDIRSTNSRPVPCARCGTTSVRRRRSSRPRRSSPQGLPPSSNSASSSGWAATVGPGHRPPRWWEDRSVAERWTKERRTEHTRQVLLDAAEEVFARKGLTGAALEEIADAAGFTRGAIYSQFGARRSCSSRSSTASVSGSSTVLPR